MFSRKGICFSIDVGRRAWEDLLCSMWAATRFYNGVLDKSVATLNRERSPPWKNGMRPIIQQLSSGLIVLRNM